jgi:hypothetical protein
MNVHEILQNLTIRRYGKKVYVELDVSEREAVVAFFKTLLQNLFERSKEKFKNLIDFRKPAIFGSQI